MNIVHVNFQVVSCSCFIIASITLEHNPLVDLLDVSLHVAGQVCAVLTFLTLERLRNQRHYEACAFTLRLEDLRVNFNSDGVGGWKASPRSSDESRGATVVFVPLKLRLREGREGTLVTEVFLAVIVVFTLLLEVAVFLSLMLVEGGVPGGPPVALVALQPPLLVPGPGVRLQVGQVVGPVLAVLAVEDMFTRVNLFVVSQPQSLVHKTGPVGTE